MHTVTVTSATLGPLPVASVLLCPPVRGDASAEVIRCAFANAEITSAVDVAIKGLNQEAVTA